MDQIKQSQILKLQAMMCKTDRQTVTSLSHEHLTVIVSEFLHKQRREREQSKAQEHQKFSPQQVATSKYQRT